MKIFEKDFDHFIVVWCNYFAFSEERKGPYFRLDDFINHHSNGPKIQKYDPIRMITEFCQSVGQYG